MLDEDDVLFARALREKGTPMPDIVKKLTIKTSKNTGQHPLSRLALPRPRRQRRLTRNYPTTWQVGL